MKKGYAHEIASKQYEQVGRALLPQCSKCGEPMHAEPKRTGRTWRCKCGNSEFEEVKR